MKPPALRVRLTAWYLGVIFTTLALYSVAMFLGLRAARERTVDHQLQDRSDSIAEFLKANRPEGSGIQPQLLPSSSGLGLSDLYQISSASGALLFQSPAMRELGVPVSTVQMRNHYRHYRDRGNFTTFYHRQGAVRVLGTKLTYGDEELRVQVAVVVSPLYDVLESFSFWAWTGLPLIGCFAGVAGYWLSGHAMKPIHDMVLATRGISDRNLKDRLVVPEARDELQELAQTMNAMLDRLESAFTRITRFTSDASHELRTPITVIRTTSEVLLEKDRSVEEYREMVTEILRESEFTSELIAQLLLLARSDSNTAQLAFEPVDLSDLVRELSLGAKSMADSRGLAWSFETPLHPLLVRGDRTYLKRLLLILVENALSYTPGGGAIQLSLNVQGDEAVLNVTDTGIGIPPAELPLIYDRFYRASNARYFDTAGTGLGLAIAQWIVVAHDGVLAATSEVGSGTSISVRLALHKPAAL